MTTPTRTVPTPAALTIRDLPARAWSTDVKIRFGECDPAGIVFNPRFFEFFDWSTAVLLERALGLSKAEMIAAHDIVGIPLVDTRARFLAPARFGDEVAIAVPAVVQSQHVRVDRGPLG